MDDQLIKIQKLFEQENSIKMAIVFGSFGTEMERPTSDIDIALSIGSPMSIEQKLHFSNLIQKSTGKEVDLIDLTVATGTVFKEAMTTGRFIVNKDSNHLGQILIRMLSEENDYQVQKREMAFSARERIFNVQGSSKPKT